MLFVVTTKWPVDKTPEIAKRSAEAAAKPPPKGLKSTHYQLLGRRELVSIVDAPNEKAILQMHMPFSDIAECDWAPAMLSEDVLKAVS